MLNNATICVLVFMRRHAPHTHTHSLDQSGMLQSKLQSTRTAATDAETNKPSSTVRPVLCIILILQMVTYFHSL